MVIGAFSAPRCGACSSPTFLAMGHSPAPYVIIGMMSCFGSISRAPLAVMLMVAEMTGTSLHPHSRHGGRRHRCLAHCAAQQTTPSTAASSRVEPTHRHSAFSSDSLFLASIPTRRAMATPRLVLIAGHHVDIARHSFID